MLQDHHGGGRCALTCWLRLPLSAGAAVLREGGNAVDAAIATALCQGVLNPQASGAGGGHFMLIRWAGRKL